MIYQKLLLCVVWGICLAGCVKVEKGESPPGVALSSLSLSADKAMNLNTAIYVDLVVVYEQNLWEKIKTMTAADYFATAPQLLRDNTKTMDVLRWEVVPQQILGPYEIDFTQRRSAWGAVVFANYQTAGAHRVIIGEDTPILKLHLGSKDLEPLAYIKDLTHQLAKSSFYNFRCL